MSGRELLHQLVDQLPEEELGQAQKVLEELGGAAVTDDEPLSATELSEIEAAGQEIREGKWYTLEQVKKDSGL